MDAQNALLRLLTGRSEYELAGDIPAGGSDKDLHSLASALMTNRIGPVNSFGVGLGRELIQGLGAGLSGESPIGEHGFDPQDIYANLHGIKTALIPTAGESLYQGLFGNRKPR